MGGICECGCGGQTAIAKQSVTSRGQIKGQPVRFIKGHSGHKYSSGETTITERWTIEDRGHDTPCWIWQLSLKGNGYGQLMAGGRNQPAHRYYYEQIHGALPRRMQLDHLCRVRRCVNPEHLEPVTNGENCRRGTNCKLRIEQVREIRSLLAQGWYQRDIGAAYGVSGVQVGNIANGKSWAGVT